jgi:RNA polymerase-binding transcription factor DksA
LCVSAGIALAEIDAALARMAEGCYGQCVRCRAQISAERLETLPMTPLCMNCHYNEENCRLAKMLSSGRG